MLLCIQYACAHMLTYPLATYICLAQFNTQYMIVLHTQNMYYSPALMDSEVVSCDVMSQLVLVPVPQQLLMY